MEVTVLGAGCLGLSAALHLAEDGHDVTVVERGQPGAGSTGKAAGICSAMTWNDDDAALIAETRGQIGQLISLAAGAVPEARGAWRSFDSIVVADAGKTPALDDMQARLEHTGEEMARLGHREAKAEFPALEFAPGEEVLVAQEDGVIEAGDWLAAMLWRLDAEGVTVQSGGAMTIASADAEGVVVAAGMHTPQLLADAGAPLPLACFRTQAASVAIPDALEMPMLHDAALGFYTRPESDGSMVAGDGTRLTPHDPDDYDEAGDPEFKQDLATRIPRRFVDGAGATIRSSWAGLCVGTPDRHPVCGPVPGLDDVWVLSGDNGFGLMRSMALGERLAQAVDGDVHAVSDPRRFDGVPLEFEMREGFAF